MAFGAFAPLPLRLGGSDIEGLTPEQHARLCADLAAFVQTMPLAIVVFTAGTASSAVAYLGQHGVGLSNAPTIAAPGAGDGTATWSATYIDRYDRPYAFRVRHVQATTMAGAARIVTATIVNSIQVRVRTFNDAGAATTSAVTLAVW